MDLSSLGL
ncbi:hypothetical protein LINGRAHAP2_LOCUS8461 [Linum grandiflorum]